MDENNEENSPEELDEENTNDLPIKEPQPNEDIESQPASPEMTEKSTESSPDEKHAEETPASNWEDQLKKPFNKNEIKMQKRRKKEEEKQKRLEKQRQLQGMAQDLVEAQFSKAFNKQSAVYTIIFLLATVSLGLITLFYYQDTTNTLYKWWQITICLTFILGAFFLLLISRNKKIHSVLFAEGKNGIKALIAIVMIFCGFVLTYLYWIFTDSQNSGPNGHANTGPINLNFWHLQNEALPPLQYSQLFFAVLIVIFFGWNIIQIWFIKNGLEGMGIRVEAHFRVKADELPTKSRNSRIGMVNTLTTIAPFVLHFVGTLLFIMMDQPDFWLSYYNNTGKPVPGWVNDIVTKLTGKLYDGQATFFFNNYVSTNATALAGLNGWQQFWSYFDAVWLNPTYPLFTVFVWALIVLGLMIITTVRQKILYRESNENKSPNIFSGFFYMLFWVILWFRFFLFIRTGVNVQLNQTSPNDPLEDIVNFILMIFTIFMALRGFATKAKTIKSAWITDFNIVFLMFAFVLSYFGGQMVLITGALFSNTNTLSLYTNLILIIVNTTFYFWYSGWVMERRGFTRKTSYTLPETRKLLIDMSLDIKGNLLQTIENEEIIMGTLNKFMMGRRIILEKPPKGEEGVVENLKKVEKELTSVERLTRAQETLKKVRIDQDLYDNAVKKLEDTKAKLADLQDQADKQKAEIDQLPPDLEEKLQQAENIKKEAQASLNDQKSKIEASKHELSQIRIPIPADPNAITSEEQSQIDATNAKKAELEELVDQLQINLPDLETALNSATESWTEAKNALDAANKLKSDLARLQSQIESTTKDIAAQEADLIVLKERADESRPSLDAATNALQMAQQEFEFYNSLEKVKADAADAAEKMKAATGKDEFAQSQLKAANDALALTKTIEQAQTDITAAEAQIEANQATLDDDRQVLLDKQAALEEKNAAVQTAQAAVTEKKGAKDEVESVVLNAQNTLSKAQDTLNKAQQNQKDLEEANKKLENYQSALENQESVADAETHLHDAQNNEKTSKSQLKEVKAAHANEPGTPAEVQSALRAIDDAEAELTKAKDAFKNAKDAQSAVDNTQKFIASLESQQIDLSQAQAALEQAQSDLQTAEDNATVPRSEFDQAQSQLTQAKTEQVAAKNDADTAAASVNQAETDVRKAQSAKTAADKALVDRQNAEMELEKAQDLVAKAQDLLAKASDNLKLKEDLRKEAEKTYELGKEDAAIEWDIFINEDELKFAHKTFKDAIRSAENNVKVRETRLESAKQRKIDLALKRQEAAERAEKDAADAAERAEVEAAEEVERAANTLREESEPLPKDIYEEFSSEQDDNLKKEDKDSDENSEEEPEEESNKEKSDDSDKESDENSEEESETAPEENYSPDDDN